jgi:hypothetical protein
MKNAADWSKVLHRMYLQELQEKVSGNLRRFVSEKMQEHEHRPLVPTISVRFGIIRRANCFSTRRPVSGQRSLTASAWRPC